MTNSQEPSQPQAPPTRPWVPRVFMSYGHENAEHKAWVLKLATDLTANGVHVVIDVWDLVPGSDLPHFMESIRAADHVLLVCTPSYKDRADRRDGGVGYENMIVTGEIAQQIITVKFIPLIRLGTEAEALPTFMTGRYYISFVDASHYKAAFEELLHAVHKVPKSPRPQMGPSPFASPLHGTPTAGIESRGAASIERKSIRQEAWLPMMYKLVTVSPMIGGPQTGDQTFRVERVTQVDVTIVKVTSSQHLVVPLDDLSDPWDLNATVPSARLEKGAIARVANGWKYIVDRNELQKVTVAPDEKRQQRMDLKRAILEKSGQFRAKIAEAYATRGKITLGQRVEMQTIWDGIRMEYFVAHTVWDAGLIMTTAAVLEDTDRHLNNFFNGSGQSLGLLDLAGRQMIEDAKKLPV
jgi:hypothetical protein